MDWKINNGIIEEVNVNGKNIIKPWGFESSDSFSFYSQLIGGNRNTILTYNFITDKNSNRGCINTVMEEGQWSLDITEKLDGNTILREHNLLTEENTFMFDYVQRYRFKKDFFKSAKINGRTLTHNKTNVYYQYKVDNITLYGSDFNVKITLLDYNGKLFEPYMYIRDFNDEWIVHVRLMPKKGDKEVVKLCTFWYNKALPQMLSDFILKSKVIREYIWLKGERKPYKFPFTLLAPNAYPEVLLKKGEKVKLISKFEVIGI